MQLKIGDLMEINNKLAVVIEVFDKRQSKKPRCMIRQDGEEYCVFCSDLKPFKGD